MKAVLGNLSAEIYVPDGRSFTVSADSREELESLVSFFLAPLGFSSCEEYGARLESADAQTVSLEEESLEAS